jgi:ATP-dependent Clp protease adaptor protein ClpS
VVSVTLAAMLAGAASGLVVGAAGKLVNARRRARVHAQLRELGPFAESIHEQAWKIARTGTPVVRERRRVVLLRAQHLMWALVQTEPFAVAIEALGGSPAAVEKRIAAHLHEPSEPVDASPILRRAYAHGKMHQRAVTCADLWLAIARLSPAAHLVDMPPLDADALSFWLVHGRREPALAASGDQLAVVLRNDDYTTVELVSTVLRDVFGLPAERALELTRAVHERGSAIVGHYPADDAVARAQRARELARHEHLPLWVSVEPA